MCALVNECRGLKAHFHLKTQMIHHPLWNDIHEPQNHNLHHGRQKLHLLPQQLVGFLRYNLPGDESQKYVLFLHRGIQQTAGKTLDFEKGQR